MFATNTLTILPAVDTIVVMKDGRIQETGSYETLRANGGEFAKLLQEHVEEETRERTANKNALQGERKSELVIIIIAYAVVRTASPPCRWVVT